MKKILVPVDYTPVSDKAVEYAISLGRSMNCEIVLFHAMQVPIPTSEIPPAYITGPDLEIEQKERLVNYHKFLTSKHTDAKISYELRYDFVKDGITGIAESSSEYRMIVMGITPAGNLMQMFPGGTAVNIINDIDLPVLIVPSECTCKDVRRISVAFDYEDLDYRKLFRPLRELALMTGAELTFTHIIKMGDEIPEEKKRKFSDQVESIFKGMKVTFAYSYNEELYVGINEILAQSGSDMLAMVHHKRGFIKSLFSTEHTRKFAYLTKLPLLVLPVD